MTVRSHLAQTAAREGKQLLGEIELDESYFGGRRKGRRGRGAAGKVKVFGLLERQGQVIAVVVPNCTKETLMAKIKAHAIKGAVFYTDEFQSNRDLGSYGKHLPIDHQKTYVEGFWSYAKQMFLRTHGVDPENFPLYLAEYQYRYNHRRDDLLALLFIQFLWPKIASKINQA
jgi:transposase